jgi:F-type H+-transporting ATPase subunit b
VLTAVTQTGASISGNLLAALSSPWLGTEVEPPESDLNPIAPEMKEIIWGFGPYVVFALLLIFVLYPKLKKGMDARYEGIRSDHEQADAMRAAARAEVAEYEAQLASVKAEAAARVDAARQQLEVKRQERLAALNARLAEERAAAAADNEAARAAVRGQIQSAVADVAGRAGELATGRAPSPDVVNRVVSEVMAR